MHDSDPPARVPARHVARQRHVEVGEDSVHVETGALASQGAAEHPDTGDRSIISSHPIRMI